MASDFLNGFQVVFAEHAKRGIASCDMAVDVLDFDVDIDDLSVYFVDVFLLFPDFGSDAIQVVERFEGLVFVLFDLFCCFCISL